MAVSFDSRIKADLFAREAARTLAGNGITVHLFPELEPTPVLSYAVRELHCQAGIMVTASHNPSKYNGYKCYGPDGCQMTDKDAGEVTGFIRQIDVFDGVTAADYDAAVAAGPVSYTHLQQGENDGEDHHDGAVPGHAQQHADAHAGEGGVAQGVGKEGHAVIDHHGAQKLSLIHISGCTRYRQSCCIRLYPYKSRTKNNTNRLLFH